MITGTAAIPLLLIKLQLVYPKLFARPVIGSPLRLLERGSIAVLVSSMIFQLFTGLMNTAQFYPWKFFFTSTQALEYFAGGPNAEEFTPAIKDFEALWLREGVHHILRVFKDRHELNDQEIALFEKLDKQCIPGFESGWTSEQAWAAEEALEALDKEAILSR